MISSDAWHTAIKCFFLLFKKILYSRKPSKYMSHVKSVFWVQISPLDSASLHSPFTNSPSPTHSWNQGNLFLPSSYHLLSSALHSLHRFPTIFWVGKDNKPEEYEDGREVKDFLEFVKRKVKLQKTELWWAKSQYGFLFQLLISFYVCLFYLISSLCRFPTIYWAPKGKKDSPRKYQGGREVDDFVKFIEKEASVSLTKKSEL